MTVHIKEIRQTAWVGLIVNCLLSALKFICGILGASQVVVADAVHTLSDSVTDIAVLLGSRYWARPPDATHPYGHRRIETITTIFIALCLACVACSLVYNALTTLNKGSAHSPGWIAFWATLVSICTKEILYRWSISVGRRVASPAVIANAWHQRSDALSSIPAAAAVAVSAANPSLWFIDSIGTVVVSLFILNVSWKIAGPALNELIDTGASSEDIDTIKKLALEIPGVHEVHGLRTRYVGSQLQLDLHILVDPDLTVREGHAIAGRVKTCIIQEGPDVADAIVHLEPYERDNSLT